MNTLSHLSCCPVVRDEVMRLFERVNVAGHDRLIPFERRILWLRESSTRLTLRHRGVEVKELHTNNDWYGFLTSLEMAVVEERAKLERRYQIRPGDTLSIAADLTIEDEPVTEDLTPDGREWNKPDTQRRRYLSLPRDGQWYTDDQPQVVDGVSLLPRLKSRVVCQRLLVMSPGEEIEAEVTAWIAQQRQAAAQLAASLGPHIVTLKKGQEVTR